MGNIERCWIATPPRWSGLREDLRVASARDAPDYEAQGWTIEGPFTADSRGAVEALRPYLRHAVANCTPPNSTDTEDRCVCGLSTTLRRLGGQ